MSLENSQQQPEVKPQDELLLSQQPPVGDSPEGQQQEPQEVPEEDRLIPEDSPFHHIPGAQEARDKMIEDLGLDAVKELDELVLSEQGLNDEQIAYASDKFGCKPEHFKAHIQVLKESAALREKASLLDQQEADAYLAEINSLAGEGGIESLKAFIADNAGDSKIKIWNATLKVAADHNDQELQKEVLKEMAEFRNSKVAANSGGENPQAKLGQQQKKAADLSLLTKANASNGQSNPNGGLQKKDEAPADPLAGNPLAHVHSQVLFQIKTTGPQHPQYKQAMAVIGVRHPDLV